MSDSGFVAVGAGAGIVIALAILRGFWAWRARRRAQRVMAEIDRIAREYAADELANLKANNRVAVMAVHLAAQRARQDALAAIARAKSSAR